MNVLRVQSAVLKWGEMKLGPAWRTQLHAAASHHNTTTITTRCVRKSGT